MSTRASSTFRQVVFVAIATTLIVSFQLIKTAQSTGNYEGMWFSLAHTVIVAIGVLFALKEPPASTPSR